jgi:sugar O-acyltransferase (sialic acid O-acetyltransferase NeuD family)
MLENIAIIGAGGFGREVQMLINQINFELPSYNFIGFFDDVITGDLILGTIEDLNTYKCKISIIIAIGDPQIKKNILKRLDNSNIKHVTLIHPNVILGYSSKSIGVGCIITAGNIITVNTQIGNFVTLNLCCTVGHDTIIDDYCSFMPGVNISGEVNVANCVYVGTGAKIINNISIGENTTIGAGSVVAKSLPSNCVAVGVPSKIIKYK